jgi:hypothetical protein
MGGGEIPLSWRPSVEEQFFQWPKWKAGVCEKGLERKKPFLAALWVVVFLSRSEGLRMNRKSHLGSPDLVPPEPFDPPTHSLSSCCFKIEDDVSIFIEVEDGKIFFSINDDGILP